MYVENADTLLKIVEMVKRDVTSVVLRTDTLPSEEAWLIGNLAASVEKLANVVKILCQLSSGKTFADLTKSREDREKAICEEIDEHLGDEQ